MISNNLFIPDINPLSYQVSSIIIQGITKRRPGERLTPSAPLAHGSNGSRRGGPLFGLCEGYILLIDVFNALALYKP